MVNQTNTTEETLVLIEELSALKSEIEETINFVKSLPNDRRFFLNTGFLCIEMDKEEALKNLQENLKEVEEKLQKLREGGKL